MKGNENECLIRWGLFWDELLYDNVDGISFVYREVNEVAPSLANQTLINKVIYVDWGWTSLCKLSFTTWLA